MMLASPETPKFLPQGALKSLVNQVQSAPGLTTLTAALEDQSQCTLGDVFWGVRKWIINLGALSIAAHLKHLGVGTVHAYYPVMKGKRVDKQYDLVGLSCSEVSVAACMDRIQELRAQPGERALIIVGGPE